MNQVYGDYVDQYYIDKKNQFRIKPDPSKVFGLVFITLFLHVRIWHVKFVHSKQEFSFLLPNILWGYGKGINP
jgi:hypothetical protein